MYMDIRRVLTTSSPDKETKKKEKKTENEQQITCKNYRGWWCLCWMMKIKYFYV